MDNETLSIDTEVEAPLSIVWIVIIGALLVLLIAISMAGNALVCAAIFTDRGLHDKVGNLFLASLAIADLLVAALVMTFAGVNDLMGYWMFGAWFCDAWVAFDVMGSTASIINLCVISLDRYIHIKDPLRYDQLMTRGRVCFGIAIIWGVAAIVSFLPISYQWHRPPQSPTEESNQLPTCALDLNPLYAVLSSCISFVLPCFVMVGIYCRLYLYAQRHVKSIRAVTRPLQMKMNAADGAVTTTTTPCHVSDHKAAITVGVIMGVFLVCWVPFFVVNIVAGFCKTCIPGLAFKILTWLGYSNSAFNPIIYSIFNTEFREAFYRILTTHARPLCCCSKCCSQYQVVGGGSGAETFGAASHAACSSRAAAADGAAAVVSASNVNAANGACDPLQCSTGSVDTSRQTRLNSAEISIQSEDNEKSFEV